MSLLAEISHERNKKQNAIEELKSRLDFKAAFEKLSHYAERGYDSIGEEDKKFTLKSFGIFDRPATPGLFMLRVRIPAGRISIEQAKTIAKIASRYAKDYIDITTRAQIELRYIAIEDIVQILDELSSVGICSFQTGVDNFRNIVCDPLSGFAFDSYIDTSSELFAMQEIFLGDFEWVSALPRKFNIGINGSVNNRCNIFGQDLGFTLASKDGIYGYNVMLGGKVGAAAQNADIFIQKGEAAPFFEKLAMFFREFGFRDNRNKNRLKFMIDSVGIDRFRAELEEYADRKFEQSGKTMLYGDGGDTRGKTALKNDSFAYLLPVPSGVFSAQKLLKAAEFCEQFGGHSLNFTIEQNIYLLGVKGNFEQKSEKSSIFHANLIACAGTEHCPFGVIPNKPDAIECAEYLAKRFGEQGGKIRQYWSACPKGCGIHQVGDVGLVGTKVSRNKETLLGVDIYIGGSLSSQKEGKLLVKGALLGEAKEFVAEAVEIYLENKISNESFERQFSSLSLLLSSQCISFIVRFNTLLHRNGLQGLKLKELSKFACGKKEDGELFFIGTYLFESIFAESPYEKTSLFGVKLGKQKTLKPKITITQIPSLAEVIKNMATPSYYEVFSEVATELQI
ncbi:MAG TPA: ferredoxin--nitrite reductase [Campylobacterales bacterium]|nr:ferredoxin--nitrite reductase [Campylobacterales bacterium]